MSSESTSSLTIFLLGATGFVGGELLILLAEKYPRYPIVALVRSPTPERIAQLKALHPSLDVVSGTLSDDLVIQEQAAKADIVINVASSDHIASVKCA